MFKFMMLFRQPQHLESFENSYNDLLALVERMPNVQRRQVINVVGSATGASPYYRILEVYFEDRRVMEAALLSKQGQEAGGQLMTFPAGTFETIFAEVYEEAGGSTPTPQQDTGTTHEGA
ncbi:MAG: EthD family reductase [bacterium]|nr:EthD family reductase [bacterium]